MTTTYTIEREFAVYTVEEFAGHIEVAVNYTTSIDTGLNFYVFYTYDEMMTHIEKQHKVIKVMSIIAAHTEEMEGYSYYGSNPGVPQDEYEDVAEEIIKEFGI